MPILIFYFTLFSEVLLSLVIKVDFHFQCLNPSANTITTMGIGIQCSITSSASSSGSSRRPLQPPLCPRCSHNHRNSSLSFSRKDPSLTSTSNPHPRLQRERTSSPRPPQCCRRKGHRRQWIKLAWNSICRLRRPANFCPLMKTRRLELHS